MTKTAINEIEFALKNPQAGMMNDAIAAFEHIKTVLHFAKRVSEVDRANDLLMECEQAFLSESIKHI